jgi:hypothetical protein
MVGGTTRAVGGSRFHGRLRVKSTRPPTLGAVLIGQHPILYLPTECGPTLAAELAPAVHSNHRSGVEIVAHETRGVEVPRWIA